MPVNAQRIYERIWSYTGQFAAGDDITRSDHDTHDGDLEDGINAALSATPHPTTASGIAATSDTDVFWVRDSTSIRKYTNNAGVAELQETVAFQSSVDLRQVSFISRAAFVAADLSAFADGTVVMVAGKFWLKSTGETDYSKNDWTPIDVLTATVMQYWADNLINGEETPPIDGVIYRKDSTATGDDSAVHHLSVDGFRPAAQAVTPEMFGAANDGVTDDTLAWNNALQYAAQETAAEDADDLPYIFRSNGEYRIQGTIGAYGRVRMETGDTTLVCTGISTANLTEILENPTGTTVPQASGKYVIFDTKDMGRSYHSGNLHIQVYNPGAMDGEGQAGVPQNIVGISTSEGASRAIVWGRIRMTGVYHPFWQGDQRGTGQTNLPYTGMYIEYLEEFFCGPSIGGQSGNFTDDVYIEKWDKTRCFGRSIWRVTSLHMGNFFCSGKNQSGSNANHDAETTTAGTTAGSNTVTFSAANAYIDVGTVLAIDGAGLNLTGGGIWHLCEVEEVLSATSVRVDLAPEVTVATGELILDPPSMLIETTNCTFNEAYGEEILANLFQISNRGAIQGLVRQSEGTVSGFYGTPILVKPTNNAAVDIALHNRGTNSNNTKYAVGVGVLRENVSDRTAARVTVSSQYARDAVTVNRPIGIVVLRDADVPSGFTEASGQYNRELLLETAYAGARVTQQRFAPGNDAFSIGQDGNVEYTQIAVIDDWGSPIGNVSGPSSSLITKTPGATGRIQIAASPSTRYCLTFAYSSFTSGTPAIQAYDSGGTIIGDTIVTLPNADDRYKVHFDTPAGTATIRINAFENSEWVLNELTLRQVIDT